MCDLCLCDSVSLDIVIGENPPNSTLSAEEFTKALFKRKGFTFHVVKQTHGHYKRGDLYLVRYNYPSFHFWRISEISDEFLKSKTSDELNKFKSDLEIIDEGVYTGNIEDIFLLGEILETNNWFRQRYPLKTFYPSFIKAVKKARLVLNDSYSH